MLLTPRRTEKAYQEAAAGTYIFNVPLSANKQQVAAEIKQAYQVDISDVRFVITKGKMHRTYRSASKNPVISQAKSRKKAYVRLAVGQSLDLFKDQEAEETN